MPTAVHDNCVRIYADARGVSSDEAKSWMSDIERQHGPYVADVLA
ncbi:hypothetical protein [Micromonospora globispora]|nr:hypothetical protein [Micromonospora globispora]